MNSSLVVSVSYPSKSHHFLGKCRTDILHYLTQDPNLLRSYIANHEENSREGISLLGLLVSEFLSPYRIVAVLLVQAVNYIPVKPSCFWVCSSLCRGRANCALLHWQGFPCPNCSLSLSLSRLAKLMLLCCYKTPGLAS